jgi:nitrate reductase gamma subunit
LAMIATLSLTVAYPVGASWFVDAGRFHASVHGQISCGECHVSISKEAPHPDPAHVNKALNDFFRADRCASCHEDVVTKLDSGTHAGKPIQSRREYNVCIGCHDPHYQLSTKNAAPSFDPTKPVNQQCGACHAQRTALRVMSAQDEKCMACHRSVETGTSDGVNRVAAFCFECHGKSKSTNEGISVSAAGPLIDVPGYQSTAHSGLSCLVCHPKSAEFGHTKRELPACLSCHRRHDEKVAHDAHLRVSCEACHLAGVIPIKSAESEKVLWKIDGKPGRPSDVHSMTLKYDENSCRRCHHSGNTLGAAAMVLPPKSILCMPCHAATFSVGDTTTIISLLVFLAGLTGLSAVWFSGSLSTAREATLETGSGKVGGAFRMAVLLSGMLNVLKTVALDALLQRRLFRQSRTRWLVHGMIFFPFMFRFLWGITALLTSLWAAGSSVPWILLDKNYPLGAFLFDLSGESILLGVIFTAMRRIVARPQDVAGLSKQDWLALFLIGVIVAVGFVLEGMRIAMQGSPVGSEYAFLGYAISRLFADTPTLPATYGYVWHLHAIATGAFIAYLPFSHLPHIVVAPVVMAMNAVTRTSERYDKRPLVRERI